FATILRQTTNKNNADAGLESQPYFLPPAAGLAAGAFAAGAFPAGAFAPAAAAAGAAVPAAAPSAPSAPSSSFFFFFFFIVSLRTRTFGKPSGESPSFQRSASSSREMRSTRVITLRLRVAPRRTRKLLSIVMGLAPNNTWSFCSGPTSIWHDGQSAQAGEMSGSGTV